MTITTVRGNTITAAVNVAVALAVLGADTAATLRVPPGKTTIQSVRTAYSSNGATVGASGGQLHLITTTGEYWLPMGASGGQNATGEGATSEPSDVVKCNIPVTPGETITIEGFIVNTDDGTQAMQAELTFGNGGGPRNRFDVRAGAATALNTGVAMLVRGSSTTAGPFTVPADMSRIEAALVCGAADFAAVNSSTCTCVLQGDGLEGGTQAFLIACAGSTLATTGPKMCPMTVSPVSATVSANSTISATVFMGGVDTGSWLGQIGLQYA